MLGLLFHVLYIVSCDAILGPSCTVRCPRATESLVLLYVCLCICNRLTCYYKHGGFLFLFWCVCVCVVFVFHAVSVTHNSHPGTNHPHIPGCSTMAVVHIMFSYRVNKHTVFGQPRCGQVGHSTLLMPLGKQVSGEEIPQIRLSPLA